MPNTTHQTKLVKTTHSKPPSNLKEDDMVPATDDMQEGYEESDTETMRQKCEGLIASMSPEELQMLVDMAQSKLGETSTEETPEITEEIV